MNFNPFWTECCACMFQRLSGFEHDVHKKPEGGWSEGVERCVDAALLGLSRPNKGSHRDMYVFDRKAYGSLRQIAEEYFSGGEIRAGGDPCPAHPSKQHPAEP